MNAQHLQHLVVQWLLGDIPRRTTREVHEPSGFAPTREGADPEHEGANPERLAGWLAG